MAVTTFMAMLCLTGVAFCVRFLVALGKERKVTRRCFGLRLRNGSNQEVIRNRGNTINQLIERPGNGLDVERSLTPLATLGNTNRSEKGYF